VDMSEIEGSSHLQTVAEHKARIDKLVAQLKQALDTVDEKNKRIQELDNKCIEYESLLTTQGEQAFDNFERKLADFKSHHVSTVKKVRHVSLHMHITFPHSYHTCGVRVLQLLQKHENLVQHVESKLAVIPRQKQRISDQKSTIEDLRVQVRQLKSQYHVQEIGALSQKLARTERHFKLNKERLTKAENELRLSKQTNVDLKSEMEKLRSANKAHKQRLEAIAERNTRREANKFVDGCTVGIATAPLVRITMDVMFRYSDLFKKAGKMVSLEQFRKEELAAEV